MPRVFLSYSRDSESHNRAVKKLAAWLAEGGVEAHYVKKDRTPTKGWSSWMQEQLSLADFVIVIGSRGYKTLLDRRSDEALEDMRKTKRMAAPRLAGDWTDTVTSEIFYEKSLRRSNIIIAMFEGCSLSEGIPEFLNSCDSYRLPEDGQSLMRRIAKQNNAFQRIDVETVDGFLNAISPTHERWRQGRWFFRGLSTASWHLTPSLFRISWALWSSPESLYHDAYIQWLSHHDPSLRGTALPKDDSLKTRAIALAYRYVEWRMLCDFLHSANLNGFAVPDFDYWWTTTKSDDELDKGLKEYGFWPIHRVMHQLAFAQHHGVPTRLLDWSISPHTASWFAVSNAVEALYRHQINERPIAYEEPDDARFCVWAIDALGGELTGADASLSIVEPGYQLNARINAQKGVFTLLRPGAACLSYGVEMLGHDIFIKQQVAKDRPCLIQIAAPHRIAPPVLHALARFGTTRSTLFPTVDQVYAGNTDTFRATALEGMKWLNDPKRYYVPKNGMFTPFYLPEAEQRSVKACLNPEETTLQAVFRLFRQGLKAEAALKSGASKKRPKRANK